VLRKSTDPRVGSSAGNQAAEVARPLLPTTTRRVACLIGLDFVFLVYETATYSQFSDQIFTDSGLPWSHLSVAAHHVLEARQLLDADGAARVHPPRRDPNLGTHAELASVRELRRGVVQHDGAVHPL